MTELNAWLPRLDVVSSVRPLAITLDFGATAVSGWDITALVYPFEASPDVALEVTATYPTATTARLLFSEQQMGLLADTFDEGWWVVRRGSPSDEPMCQGSFVAGAASGSGTSTPTDITVLLDDLTVAVTVTVGSAGSPGTDGVDGIDGIDGTDGTDGTDGLSILSGAGAPGAGLGVDGEFYIDTVAVAIYGPKTSGAWGSPTSLIGPDGIDGTDGTDGIDGIDGTDGKTIRNGSGVPSSGLGVDGDFYIDTTAKTIYGPKTSGAWGSSTSIVGPTGAAGTSLLPVEMQVVPIGTVLVAANQIGQRAFRVPAELNGYIISAPAGCVFTVSTSGLPTFQLHKKPNGGAEVNVLSTALTIDVNELDSSTATTAAAVNGTNATVATGDLLYWECTTAGTGTKGANLKFLLTAP